VIEVRTKQCPECKLEIPADANRCAHCRQTLWTPRNLILGVIALGLWWWWGGWTLLTDGIRESHEAIQQMHDAASALDHK
jgi:hypothetical protein